MRITQVVKELEMDLAESLTESQNQRDKRVEELWKKLDPQAKGELDIKGLQKGLQKIDHPMKNADDMLKDIIKVVDTNRDGKIQFEEFRTFVEAAERQLLLLFRSIDRNQDGKVGPDELQAAFHKAGLAVPRRRLAGFFDEMDMNNDGYISFDEWRDFLLFMPPNHGSPLEAALSYYSSIVTLNAEGDSMVADETLEGLGTTGFLLQALFGSILKIAQPTPPPGPGPGPGTTTSSTSSTPYPYPDPTTQSRQPPTSSELKPPLHPNAKRSKTTDDKMAAAYASYPQAAAGSVSNTAVKTVAFIQETSEDNTENAQVMGSTGTYETNGGDLHDHQPSLDLRELDEFDVEEEISETGLTQYLPDIGYFVAGAVSGGISRTATAPLDRLKVAMLVNTEVKPGDGTKAGFSKTKPIGEAVRDLYRAGGFRTFFAGNGLNVIKIMPETAIKFGTYEAAKRTLAGLEGHGDPLRINPYSKFAAGGVAGMTAQFCVYPLDTLKFRMQCEIVQGGPTGNALLVQTVKKMVAEGGFRTAYRGITMGLLGMFPYSAIDMGTFEFLKKTFTHHKARYYGIHEEDAAPGNFATGIIGATSGAFGASVVYPMNVLRTRLQTQGTAMHRPTYTGIWDVAHRTYVNEGMRGMYKGLAPNLLKVAPALSITWVVYENSKRIMGLH